MMHDVGTDTSSKFSVVMDSRMKDGNLGGDPQGAGKAGMGSEGQLERAPVRTLFALTWGAGALPSLRLDFLWHSLPC